MAVVAWFEFPGEPIENYDRGIAQDADAKRDQPDRLFHVSFETDDGWAVLDVWESEEALARFNEVLGLPPERQPRVYPVHTMM